MSDRDTKKCDRVFGCDLGCKYRPVCNNNRACSPFESLRVNIGRFGLLYRDFSGYAEKSICGRADTVKKVLGFIKREFGDYIIWYWFDDLAYWQIFLLGLIFKHIRIGYSTDYYWVFIGRGWRGINSHVLRTYREMLVRMDKVYRNDARWDSELMIPRDVKNWGKVMYELIGSMSRTTADKVADVYPQVVDFFNREDVHVDSWYMDGGLINVEITAGNYRVTLGFTGVGDTVWKVCGLKFYDKRDNKCFSKETMDKSTKGGAYLNGLDFMQVVELIKSGEEGIDMVVDRYRIAKSGIEYRKALQRILEYGNEFGNARLVGGKEL